MSCHHFNQMSDTRAVWIIYSNLCTGCITQQQQQHQKKTNPKPTCFSDLTFFFSCKNQELASFEKLLMEKLSSDIIHLAVKCHLEIKHEDALFRKHQTNLCHGKKSSSCVWRHESQNFNEVHAYWQTRLVCRLFCFVFCCVFEVASMSQGPCDWAVLIQLPLIVPEWEAEGSSICQPIFCRMVYAGDRSCLLRAVIQVYWNHWKSFNWFQWVWASTLTKD